ncbi:hypothetical protein KSF_044790 [Reticulibacter mediterranei]|uniref:Uncharacterized protein n=1 Tax=Reticulibacter mediterranei TaxID=2778369 RepID=A0A8J3ISC9_9CHLR|nr:hypothetical protein [Reticulibacter mediterranei]GHO94431.1 hypothetical protein KSF_044790 [Reticulibacter mediterranei]
MVKTTDTTKPAPSQKKQTKKQAKRETKLQAKIKQARQDVQKAEKKVNRVQSKLADAQAHVFNLEEQLSQLQSSRQSLNGIPAASSNDQQAELPPLDMLVTEAEAPAAQEEAIEELHQESLPPVEGRADVPADQPAATENQEPSSESTEEQENVAVPAPEEALSETNTQSEENLSTDEQADAETSKAPEAVNDEQSADNTPTTEEALHRRKTRRGSDKTTAEEQ